MKPKIDEQAVEKYAFEEARSVEKRSAGLIKSGFIQASNQSIRAHRAGQEVGFVNGFNAAIELLRNVDRSLIIDGSFRIAATWLEEQRDKE